MRRREFITLIGSATVTWPLASVAQEVGRTYRLGILFPFPREHPLMVLLMDDLRRRGFIDGQNLAINYRVFGQHPELISEYAAQLIKSEADVLCVGGGGAIRVVQQATKSIPILGVTDDIVGEGLVDSLARPNGNTTGISILATELDGKRQDILIEAVPGIHRMAALADSNVTSVAQVEALQEAALARNIELSIHRVAKPDEIAAAINKANALEARALNVLASPMLYANRQLIMHRVAELRAPTMYQWPEIAEEGGFVAYGPRLGEIFRELVAPVIVKLLRGAKPADVPVEQPTKFELVINLKTAKALGLAIPESFLVRADKVIE
jgi:putative tryptophan/tyrosine transport system substrate-binding protein